MYIYMCVTTTKEKEPMNMRNSNGIFRKMHRRYFSEETEGKNDRIAISKNEKIIYKTKL